VMCCTASSAAAATASWPRLQEAQHMGSAVHHQLQQPDITMPNINVCRSHTEGMLYFSMPCIETTKQLSLRMPPELLLQARTAPAGACCSRNSRSTLLLLSF
jgi:hypothetical protein